MCLEPAVQVLVTDGVRYVRELVEWGARFDRDIHGALSLGREGAHGRRRVLHAADATGRELGRTLWERVAEHDRVRVSAMRAFTSCSCATAAASARDLPR